jgi:uncharacterized protein YraI
VPTFTPRPSLTLAPPTVVPTIAPVTGIVSTQVNVRSSPDANANALGLLTYNDRVQIIGKDTTERWLMIIYPAGSSTTAWVTATYIKLNTDDISKLPVMQVVLPAVSTDAAIQPGGTPQPSATPASKLRLATIKTTINVRAGPASAYASLGMINAGTIVVVTGRNEINTWLQIEYADSPDAHGWVATAYVDGAVLQGLPYFDNQGQLIYAPTGVANPGQPTLTPTSFSPAATDGDSEQNPAVRLEFSPSGAGALSYSSELSAPNGDDADWVAFIPYIPTSEAGYVYMRLTCAGNGGITATLEKDGQPVPEVPQLVCGNYDLAMKVLGGQTYMLVLRADGSGGPLRFISYILTISTNP